MTNYVDAVYENGVLRPLAPLPLEEHQRVRVAVSSISDDTLASLVDRSFLEQAREGVAAASYIPTHEEVRRMTAKDAGSWSEAIIAEREGAPLKTVTYFFDSSALIKLYHPELGAQRVADMFGEPGHRIVVSRLAGVELHSALSLKTRTGQLDADRSAALRIRFLDDSRDRRDLAGRG